MSSQRETWTEYVQRITSGVPRKEIAFAAGVDPSGISRWIGGQLPRAEKAIGFARGLKQRPVEALIAAGYLEPEEVVGAFEVTRSASELSDDELLAELAGRLTRRASALQLIGELGLTEEADDITSRLTTFTEEPGEDV